jgi:excisionase family DNA binding protein
MNIDAEYPGRVFFSKREVSRILGISTKTIDRRIMSGKVEIAKMAGRGSGEIRIPKSELLKLLEVCDV